MFRQIRNSVLLPVSQDKGQKVQWLLRNLDLEKISETCDQHQDKGNNVLTFFTFGSPDKRLLLRRGLSRPVQPVNGFHRMK